MLPLVDQLATTWASIDALCESLDEADWKRPTGCPGWSVQDQVSHLIDYESYALGRARPDHEVTDVGHTRNEMGARNEIGVDARRGRTPTEVLSEFREVTAARRQRLGELTEADLGRETETPIGPGTARDLLTLRVMDTWSHEQDIRRAVGRPGHSDGPVVETAIGYFGRFLPYVVAKLAGAPDGTTVVFNIGDLPPVAVEVADGRGRAPGSVPESPTVSVRAGVDVFAALVCGRTDAPPDGVVLEGDDDLGRRIVAHLGFMP